MIGSSALCPRRARIPFFCSLGIGSIFVLTAASVASAQVPRFGESGPVDPVAASTDSWHDTSPAVAMDGRGNVVIAWDSTDTASDTLGRDADVLFVRSTDGGLTWTSLATLNSNAAEDTGNDTGVALETDGEVWLAVWGSEDDFGETVGKDMDLFYARSTDAGLSWSAPAALGRNARHDWGDDYEPSIATDGKETWIVVWESKATLMNTVGGDSDIMFTVSTDDARTWSPPRALNTNAANDSGFDSSPSVAFDEKGGWLTVWSTNSALGAKLGADRDIAYSLSKDGRIWSAPRAIADNATTDGRPDWEPDVEAGKPGTWLVAWSTSDTLGDRVGLDRDLVFVRSTDGGASWSSPVPLNTNAAKDAGDDSGVALATDSRGAWLAVWSSWDLLGATLNADADLFVASSMDDGIHWTYPIALDRAATSDHGEDLHPAVETDGSGNWVVTWQTNEPQGQKLGIDLDVFYAVARMGAAESEGP